MQRPDKPHPDFPLFANLNGQWCKKVTKRPYYFGRWAEDPKGEAALKDWLARKDGILAGLDNLRLSDKTTGFTLLELATKYRDARRQDLLEGKLADETYEDYRTELTAFVNYVGANAQVAKLTPDVFAKYAASLTNERKLGVHAQKRVKAYVKAMFNYAAGEGWITPVNFGNAFKAPDTSPEAIAQTKLRAGDDGEEPIFTEEQIDALLRHAKPDMKAMIYLALNCGLGPSDLARLKWSHIQGKRLSNRRGKTGIRREAYLWKATREALAVLPRSADGLVFHTRYGTPIVNKVRVYKEENGKRVVAKIRTTNAVVGPFKRLKEAAGKDVAIEKSLTFYNLRHTHRTHTDNNRDTNAVLRTMGHALRGMDRRYVRRPFKLGRLRRVAMTGYRYTFIARWKRMKQAKIDAAAAASGQPAMRLVS